MNQMIDTITNAVNLIYEIGTVISDLFCGLLLGGDCCKLCFRTRMKLIKVKRKDETALDWTTLVCEPCLVIYKHGRQMDIEL